jgi:CelD/BcsL family acetyltransferase involved in cellulose biosynthesis
MTPALAKQTAHRFQPLNDSRWDGFLQRHPRAAIFHTSAWLQALQRTYGYEPAAFTTCPPGAELSNAVVFCRVKSWLSGRCLISLPFSDHCEPLVDTAEQLECLLAAGSGEADADKAKFLEIRPIAPLGAAAEGLEEGDGFCFHQLDLQPSLDEIFGRFHKDCVQRKIRRAHREGLQYEEGASESQLSRFYHLLVLSRRRQLLPPQPRAWFRNLIACMGDRLKIRIASKDGRPVASILTLRYKDTLVYKYGCSDPQFNNLGGMPLLFWKAIEEAKSAGLTRFDLGRSDWDNPGLITFKDRWGAQRSALRYRISSRGPARASTPGWQMQFARRIFGHMPSAVLPLAGSLVYRHLQRPRS